MEFMSRPEVQLEWYKTMKDLPAAQEAWKDPLFSRNQELKVFGEQLKDAESPPAIPEWEQIAEHIDSRMEAIILGEGILGGNIEKSLASLDAEMQKILAKKQAPKMAAGKLFFSFVAVFIALLAV